MQVDIRIAGLGDLLRLVVRALLRRPRLRLRRLLVDHRPDGSLQDNLVIGPLRLDLLVQLGPPCGLNPTRRNSKQEILNGRQHHKRRLARSCHSRCGLDNRALGEEPVGIVRLDTRLAGHEDGLLHGSRNGNDLQILAATRLRITTLLAGHAPVFFLLTARSDVLRSCNFSLEIASMRGRDGASPALVLPEQRDDGPDCVGALLDLVHLDVVLAVLEDFFARSEPRSLKNSCSSAAVKEILDQVPQWHDLVPTRSLFHGTW